MQDIVRLAKATEYAARMHAGHRRKGAAGSPYVNHVTEVAAILAEATDGRDLDLIIAGLLHDVLEDVPETPREKALLAREVEALFGAAVRSIVEEVTDDKTLPKEERKRLQEVTAPNKSPQAKMLKIADKASNVRELIDDPPADWDMARRREYVEWGKRVVDGCRGVSAELEAGYDATYARARCVLDLG